MPPRFYVRHLKTIVLLSVLRIRRCLRRSTLLVFDPGVVNGSAEDDRNGGCSSADRHLSSLLIVQSRWKTHVVITSLNNHTPSTEPATPLTAEETMWVMGEVTLIDNRLAMLIKKPKTPWVYRQAMAHSCLQVRHTVIAEPQRKVLNGEIPTVKGPGSAKRAATAGTSPETTITGTRAMAL